jgi:hypothetical protein
MSPRRAAVMSPRQAVVMSLRRAVVMSLRRAAVMSPRRAAVTNPRRNPNPAERAARPLRRKLNKKKSLRRMPQTLFICFGEANPFTGRDS